MKLIELIKQKKYPFIIKTTESHNTNEYLIFPKEKLAIGVEDDDYWVNGNGALTENDFSVEVVLVDEFEGATLDKEVIYQLLIMNCGDM